MDMVMNTPYIPKLGETINGLGYELFDCITNATKISTIVIGKKGASTSIPSKEEVEGTQFDIPEMVKLK